MDRLQDKDSVEKMGQVKSGQVRSSIKGHIIYTRQG